jgi:flagellar hook-length control protein FliK
VANDIVKSTLPLSVAPTPAADIARAATKGPSVNQALARRDDTAGRSFADELSRGPAREAKGPAEKDRPLSSDQPKKIKETVRKAANSSRGSVESTPTVAFLSGHLEQLDQAKIPTLPSDSKFLGDALAQDDLIGFMNQPTTINEMIRDLGLPPSFTAEANKLGLDFNEQITPASFLKAIGVDPQRVLAELSLLKGNILAEGMTPYLNRAAALNGMGAQAANSGLAAGDGNINDKLSGVPLVGESVGYCVVDASAGNLDRNLNNLNADRLDQLNASLAAANLLNASALLAAQQLQAQQQAVPVDLAKLADMSSGIKIEGVRPESVQMFKILASPDQQEFLITEVDPQLAAMQFAAGLGVAQANLTSLNADRLDQLNADPRTLMPVDRMSEFPDQIRTDDLLMQGPASMNRATFDAFAVMGEQLKGVDTMRFDVQKLAADSADKAAADSSILYGPNSPIGTSPFSAALNSAPPTAGAQFSAVDKLMNRLDGIDLQSSTKAKLPGISDALGQVQDARLAVPDLSANSSRGGGDSSSRQDNGSSNQGGSQFGQEKSVNETPINRSVAQPSRTNSAPSTFAARGENAEVGLSPQQRFQIMQKVMNHATMMVREGGGTVRLDLGSPELGSMQVAINMNKDQMDMRVITSSDRVREAMMAELGQLKNALSVQNVRLGNVEVGVQGRQPNGFAGFDNNAGQNSGRGFDGRQPADQRSLSGIQGIGNVARQSSVRFEPVNMPNVFASNGGRIAVRA